MSPEQINALLESFAEVVAKKVVEQLRAGEVGMIDQSSSPLGRRRHIAVVRRLVAEGQPGAAEVGRRYLLSRERLEEALAEQGRKAGKKKAAPRQEHDVLAELRRKYAA